MNSNASINNYKKQKCKIGLSLAGGGLQGFAHIGAIKALEELKIDISAISGTSTGSVVACLYALGYNSSEIEEICEKNYKKILKFRKKILLKMGINYLLFKNTKTPGIIDGKKIIDFINYYASKKNIDKIKDIKNVFLAIETVDTKTMKECIFVSKEVKNINEKAEYIDDIDLGKAVQASMAFPAIFTPLNYNQYTFIDGGTVNNLPVKILRDTGIEKVISVSFDLNKYIPSQNMENIVVRALDIFSSNSVFEGRKLSDISIEIYNPDTGLLNIDSMKKTINNGYQAVMNCKEDLLKLKNELN